MANRGTTQQLPYKTYATCNGDSSAIWEDWTSTTVDTEPCWYTWTISCQYEYTEAVSPLDDNVREPTAEEIEQRNKEEAQRYHLRKAEDARLEKERKKEAIQKKKAERKARKLLFDLIGKTDYRQFMHLGYLDVEGKSGRVYRISPQGATTRVFEGKDKLDVGLESLCIVTRDCRLPAADELLWKKLMIETDEEEFVSVANKM